MTQETVARLFELVLLVAAGAGLAGIVAAGIYDLKAVAHRPRIAKAIKGLQKSTQPSMTVIVYACNDAETIAACLASLRQGQYHNHDIVVVDNASGDGTQRIIRAFKRRYPKFAMRFHAKRKRVALEEALRHGYKKSRKGDLVVTLAATSRPSPSFLKEVAARFAAEPALTGLKTGEYAASTLTIARLAPEVRRLVGNILTKSLSLLNVRRDPIGLNGAYRLSLFMNGKRANIRYEGALLLPVVRHGQRPNIVFRWPIVGVVTAVVTLLLMTYAMAMAALLVSPAPLALGWSLVTAGSVAAIWSDESVRPMQKLQLTFAAPLIFFLLYVALLSFLLERILIGVRISVASVRPRTGWLLRRRAIS